MKELPLEMSLTKTLKGVGNQPARNDSENEGRDPHHNARKRHSGEGFDGDSSTKRRQALSTKAGLREVSIDPCDFPTINDHISKASHPLGGSYPNSVDPGVGTACISESDDGKGTTACKDDSPKRSCSRQKGLRRDQK